jgi:HAD superfamily hydrolase (TIGR01509 family)
MPLDTARKPDWDRIDTVLLDLDGTLLDLAYDNYLWLQRVPVEYAAARGLSVDAAREQLAPRFRACEGTLDWYCIEHWSRELGLDIARLHREEGARIAWLPGAPEFLARVRALGKRVVLLTNSHPELLRIKDVKAGVSRHFDALFSSHTFRVPKEDPRFWGAVRTVEPFDPERSMFVDDSLPVLRAGRDAGIRWIYAVRPAPSEFATVASVQELIV